MNTKRILVIIDAQNDFIDGTLYNKDAIKVVPNIVNKIKEKWDFIFMTQDTHYSNYLETREGKKLPTEHCIACTYGWLINESIMKAVEESKIPYYVSSKYTFGHETIAEDIDSMLNPGNPGIEDVDEYYIELVGFCTDICVITNALIIKTHMYSFADITVDASCCAGTSIEKHNEALDVMKSCQIDIINE